MDTGRRNAYGLLITSVPADSIKILFSLPIPLEVKTSGGIVFFRIQAKIGIDEN
jgi:hypothetical protein